MRVIRGRRGRQRLRWDRGLRGRQAHEENPADLEAALDPFALYAALPSLTEADFDDVIGGRGTGAGRLLGNAVPVLQLYRQGELLHRMKGARGPADLRRELAPFLGDEPAA